ncbi:MAG: hypothetical protein IJ880_14980 [Bacilli bacterium]|nr:hypothetical protein [Bacilli bacterium]
MKKRRKRSLKYILSNDGIFTKKRTEYDLNRTRMVELTSNPVNDKFPDEKEVVNYIKYKEYLSVYNIREDGKYSILPLTDIKGTVIDFHVSFNIEGMKFNFYATIEDYIRNFFIDQAVKRDNDSIYSMGSFIYNNGDNILNAISMKPIISSTLKEKRGIGCTIGVCKDLLKAVYGTDEVYDDNSTVVLGFNPPIINTEKSTINSIKMMNTDDRNISNVIEILRDSAPDEWFTKNGNIVIKDVMGDGFYNLKERCLYLTHYINLKREMSDVL